MTFDYTSYITAPIFIYLKNNKAHNDLWIKLDQIQSLQSADEHWLVMQTGEEIKITKDDLKFILKYIVVLNNED